MIDAGPSLKAADGLRGSAVSAYLSQTGWRTRPSRVDGISIFSRELPGLDEPVEFILPVTGDFDEEHRRIADALRTLEGVEKRSLFVIADDIRKLSSNAEPTSRNPQRSPGFAEDD
jgi:hypothetical protein